MGMMHESGSGASEEAEHAAWQQLMMAGNPAPGPGMLGQEESSVGLLTGNSVGPDQDDYRTTVGRPECFDPEHQGARKGEREEKAQPAVPGDAAATSTRPAQSGHSGSSTHRVTTNDVAPACAFLPRVIITNLVNL